MPKNHEHDPFEQLEARMACLLEEASSTNLRRLTDILDEISEFPQDEKEKLKEKDKRLLNGLDRVGKAIQAADHMPQGTARILMAMLGLLFIIEEILKELKGLHGIK